MSTPELDEVYQRADVQRALAAGNWAVILRAVLDAGLSQTEIARRTGLSQSQVSRLASGRTTAPTLRNVEALAEGLGIPRRLAGLADQEDDTDRRQFLGGTLGTLGAASLPTRSEVGDEELMMLTSLTYRRLEQRTPTRLLLGVVSSHAHLVGQLAQRADGEQQNRMLAAASEAAGLAAWLYADLVEPTNARRFYRLAIASARRSGNPLLAVYMQGSLGQYASTNGDAAQGLRLIRDAGARLKRSAPTIARAWLAALEGVALAHLGDRAALRMLDLADRYADTARHDEPVWPWVFSFDAPKIAGHRAVAAAHLRMSELAEESFRCAAVSHSPKQAAVVTVEHARSLAAGGNLAQACRLAVAAHDTGRAYGSERVRQAVRDFRSELGVNVGKVTAELDDRLHAGYTERDA